MTRDELEEAANQKYSALIKDYSDYVAFNAHKGDLGIVSLDGTFTLQELIALLEVADWFAAELKNCDK